MNCISPRARVHGSGGQRWHLTRVSGQTGVYEFSPQTYGARRCLDVFGVGTPEGTDVIQWECHGGANQRFRLAPP